ncbi:MAG: hypothetical protein RL653_1631 [Pseudomonadota bacterium]
MHAALPLHQVAPHSDSGSVPAPSGEQVPSSPATLHAWQVPPHAPLQHVPSTQCPELHSLAPAQGLPLAFCGAQVPEAQWFPGLHSASEPQACRHAAPPLHQVRLHSSAGSVPAGAAVQVPSRPGTLQAWHGPLQAVVQQYPSTHWPDRHCPGAVQALPAGKSPSHAPEVQVLPGLQSAAASTHGEMQAPCPSHHAFPQSPERSCPRGTSVQVPSVPATLQALQAPVHGVLQQYPSTHSAEAHSLAATQLAPFAFFSWHVPAAQ